MSKTNPTSVDSIILSKATASLEVSVESELANEDEDINKLLEGKDE